MLRRGFGAASRELLAQRHQLPVRRRVGVARRVCQALRCLGACDAAEANAGAREPLSFVHAAAEATGLPAASADLVAACLVAHELPAAATRALIAEALRLLRPQGSIAIMVRTRELRDASAMRPLSGCWSALVLSPFVCWSALVLSPFVCCLNCEHHVWLQRLGARAGSFCFSMHMRAGDGPGVGGIPTRLRQPLCVRRVQEHGALAAGAPTDCALYDYRQVHSLMTNLFGHAEAACAGRATSSACAVKWMPV